MFDFPFDFGGGMAQDFGAQAPIVAPPPMAPLPQTLPPAPLPEQVAGFLSNQNVTPQQFLQNPLAFVPNSGGTPSLGDSLQPTQPPANVGVPLPTPRPVGAGPGAAANAQAPGGTGDKLLDALKGLKAPAAPTPQKVSTPNSAVPAAHGSIKGGNLIALLAALGQANPTAKVPLPLGQVLGGR